MRRASGEKKEAEMKSGKVLREVLRWVGPAGIAFGVFLVFSALSGLPIQVPFLSEGPSPAFQVIESGLVLWALVMLLVGMVGLYARNVEPEAPRVVESGGPTKEDSERLEELRALEEILREEVPEEEPVAR